MNEAISSEVESKQRAFILSQLAGSDAAQKTRGELNKKIPAAAKRELQLTNETADRIRQRLVDDQYLQIIKQGRKTYFSITATGREFLASHAVPQFSVRRNTDSVDETAITDELREAQKAYLLLQLYDADDHTLPQGMANRIPKNLALSLGLKAAVANHRRAKLAEQGYLQISRSGRSNQYTLKPDGVEYLLAGTRQLEHAVIPLRGKTLNALIGAAREASFEKNAADPGAADKKAAPSHDELTNAVLAMFHELLRERFGHTGLVPIHEIRRHIATQFGPAAGRHDVLDEVIMELWRERRIGLEGISDLSGATEQQLSDSIQGVNTTLFYLEVPREQPVAP